MEQELASPCLLIVAAALVAALSGVPLLISPPSGRVRGQLSAIALMLIAACTGLTGAILTLLSAASETYQLFWSLPFGRAEIGIDPLSAWFLLPIFLIPGCAALYARGYWPAESHPGNVRRMTFFFGLMTAAMAGVVLARDAVTFLFAWEIMAISAYFLVSTEDEKREVSEAGTLYLITTHIATLVLFALFSLLNLLDGSWLFPATGALDASSPLATVVFLTALFGFGIKAGIMPLHIWLPSAHANAPSHVSAALSGVILKVGIYGLVRTLFFFHSLPLWWGCIVLLLGIISGVAGVAFAIGQHDLKRLLAYHSIENIGIIAMGLGVALIGRAIGSPAMMLLGMAGALLHVLNHAVFKALLFMGAGSIIHASGTREIDLMGGLGRKLPATALLFGVGAVAICGLPPLNGFVSELLIYLGCFRGVQGDGSGAAMTALAAPALALIGGLAVACFVKVYGIVFLGMARTQEHGQGHEAGWQMLLPMGLLALICLAVGLAPALLAGLLENASRAFLPAGMPALQPLALLSPLTMVTLMALGLLTLMAALTLWYRWRLARAPRGETITWSCGYQRPAPRIQYSASSFAQMLTGLFSFVLRQESHLPAIAGPFPRASRFHSHVPEAVLELVYIPVLKRLHRRFSGVRRLQGGLLQQYMLYILLTLVALFLCDYI
jgi:hydrogenase-4 component B